MRLGSGFESFRVLGGQFRLLWIGVGSLIALHSRAFAQVALDQFHPAPLATDGFAFSCPSVLPHASVGPVLRLDYANDPLVYGSRAALQLDSATSRECTRQCT